VRREKEREEAASGAASERESGTPRFSHALFSHPSFNSTHSKHHTPHTITTTMEAVTRLVDMGVLDDEKEGERESGSGATRRGEGGGQHGATPASSSLFSSSSLCLPLPTTHVTAAGAVAVERAHYTDR